ncbi:MAG: hypothetical protein IPL61_06680 [Myxococcales bacterium]|nr:hypothetical protein [Myxococcales bacterium]
MAVVLLVLLHAELLGRQEDISREFGFDKVELGWIDTASLGMYLGQFVHGVVGGAGGRAG